MSGDRCSYCGLKLVEGDTYILDGKNYAHASCWFEDVKEEKIYHEN